MVKITVLVRSMLCYLLIAAIVARPLPNDKEKRQASVRLMEDVQLSEKELRRNNGETLPTDGEIRFYSSSGTNLWKNGEIPYIFDKHFTSDHKKKAKKAMELWSERTCVTFRRMKNNEEKTTAIMDFVTIQYGNVTNSFVGRKDRDYINRGQDLNIKRDQAEHVRIYLHEFGHVIGLNHEHSRSDRDQYVKIHSDNIVPGVGHNFQKLNDYNKNTPYDYYSIMHYGIRDYGVPDDVTGKSKITIEILNTDGINNIDSIGAKRKLSEEDIAWVNELYKCEVTPKPPVTEPPPKFYKQFKVLLPRVPKEVPESGYKNSPKEYLKCNNESCYVQSDEKVALYLTKLGSSDGGLHIGDEVLLSSHRSSVRQGKWILCDLKNCYSSPACFNSSYNASSGQVNFAFNRSSCSNQVLKISSKLKNNGTIDNGNRIVLQYSNVRSQQEWMHCDPGGLCRRQECKRKSLAITHLNTTCDEDMDEFEAIFVS